MSKIFKISTKLLVVYGFMLLFVSIMSPLTVSAYKGTGYFTGTNFFCSTLYDGTQQCGTTAISASDNNVIYPTPSIPTNKAGFITWLTAQSGSSAGKFIIATMMGSPSEKDNLSGAIARINNPDINLSVISANPKDYGGTSLYGRRDDGSGERDYFFVSSYNPGNRNLLVFKTASDNTIRYILELGCANPVGNLGLPPSPLSWSVAVSATINKTTAAVGDTITWVHRASITGTEATDADVVYSYKNTRDWSGGGVLETIVSGSPVGTESGASSPPYVTQSSDVGKTLCRVTTATPKAKGNSGTITSTQEQCVTVSGGPPPVASTCRPWILDVDVPTDVHYGTLVPVHVTGTDTSTGLTKTWTTTQSTLNVTSDCTNGNTWNFHFVTDTYIYYHATFCTGDYCTPYDHDYTKSNTWDVNAQGPCFDYNLKTSISPLSTYQLEVNSIVNVAPKMTSDSWTQLNLGSFFATYGTHTKSKTTDWQVLQLIVDPNIPVPSISNPDPGAGNPGTATPCAYYQSLSGISGCSVLKSGSTVFSNNTNSTVMSGDNPFSTLSVTIPDQTGGTRVCFAFAAHPAASDPSYGSFSADPQWDYSAINGVRPETPCIIVVKKPKVQVWGGDLLARSNVTTTTSVKDMGTPRTYGSWAEYSLFVNGTVSGMASGSAFAGQGSVSNAVCSYSALTFANVYGNAAACTGTAGTIGHYTNARSMLDVAASFPGVGTVISGTVVPSSLGSGIYTANSDIILNASNLPIGKSVIIKAIGHTVRISGNQTYFNGPYGVISDLPQLVIIADSIIIDSNVTTIDSWLVANSGTGFISTCNGYDNQNLTVNDCSLPLIVNGPVIAKRLSLRRTAGSGVDVTSSNPNDVFSYLNGNRSATSGDPSEVFNLRADAYLWSFAHATSSGRAQTVYTTELPPRF